MNKWEFILRNDHELSKAAADVALRQVSDIILYEIEQREIKSPSAFDLAMKEQITDKIESAKAIETMRELLDTAVDYDQRIVLRTEVLIHSLDNDEKCKEAIKIKRESIQNSECLAKVQKILKEVYG
jgi:anthranilate phosphoribosyltransferase